MEHRSLAPYLVVSDDNDAVRNQCAEELAPNVAQEELREEKQVGGPVNCSDSELSIYLQALAEGFLVTYYSDTSPSVQSKSMSIVSKSYQRGKKTVVFHGSPSFQMSRNSTDDLGAELLTSYLAGFRAKTSARPVMVRDLPEAEAVCGGNTPESLAKLSPDTSSSKTVPSCELAGSSESSKTLPTSGTMRSGWYCPRKRSVPITYVSGCGLLLPTPRSTDGDRGGRGDLLQAVRGNKNSHFKLFPTPQAYSKGNSKSMPGITALDIAVRPELARHAVRAKERRKNLYPTPMSAPASAASHRQVSGRFREKMDKITGGGQLNPTWVEWLMGWPLGWTDLELLETAKCHSARPTPGRSFQEWLDINRASLETMTNESFQL